MAAGHRGPRGPLPRTCTERGARRPAHDNGVDRMTRRQLAMGLGIVLAGLGAASQAQAAPAPVVGTWLALYNGGFHRGWVQWNTNGNVTQKLDFPPKTGNDMPVGVWKKNADGSFSAFVQALIWDSAGDNQVSILKKTERVTVSGDTYSGTFTVTYYDKTTGAVTFTQTGPITATRVAMPTP